MRTWKSLLWIIVATVAVAGCGDSTSPCIRCDDTDVDGRFTERIERSFSVSGQQRIEVENFAGQVSFAMGDPNAVRVVATKRVEGREQLERIEVEMDRVGGGLRIRTHNPDELHRATVDLVITAPSGSTPRLQTAVGDVRYEGRPQGSCRFWTAVGSIRLRLPTDVNLSFELRAAVGKVHVESPFDDSAWTELGVVYGTIGSGADGHILASTTVGGVYLLP